MTPSWPPPLDSVPAWAEMRALIRGVPVAVREHTAGTVWATGPDVHPEALVTVGVGGVPRQRVIYVPLADLSVDLLHPLGRYALARALGVYWMLPRADGGSLPDEYAGHSGALLACECWRRVAGVGPLRGLAVPIGHTAWLVIASALGGASGLSGDAASPLLASYALLTEGGITLPWPATRPERLTETT